MYNDPQRPQQQPPQMNPYQQWEIQGQFTKSYTTPAIISLMLYFFFWIPGFIANVVYLLEANKTKKITGRTPEGYGCLVALLCIALAPVTLIALRILFVVLIQSH